MFIVMTQPSDGFDGEKLALPVASVTCLSQRGTGAVWLTYWADGKSNKRPLQGDFDTLVKQFDGAK